MPIQICCSLLLFFLMFIYWFWQRETERERERAHMSRGGAEREREREGEWERIPSRLHTVSTESDTWLEHTNCETMTWAEVTHLTNWATQAPLILSNHISVVFHDFRKFGNYWKWCLGVTLSLKHKMSEFLIFSFPKQLCTLHTISQLCLTANIGLSPSTSVCSSPFSYYQLPCGLRVSLWPVSSSSL